MASKNCWYQSSFTAQTRWGSILIIHNPKEIGIDRWSERCWSWCGTCSSPRIFRNHGVVEEFAHILEHLDPNQVVFDVSLLRASNRHCYSCSLLPIWIASSTQTWQWWKMETPPFMEDVSIKIKPRFIAGFWVAMFDYRRFMDKCPQTTKYYQGHPLFVGMVNQPGGWWNGASATPKLGIHLGLQLRLQMNIPP